MIIINTPLREANNLNQQWGIPRLWEWHRNKLVCDGRTVYIEKTNKEGLEITTMYTALEKASVQMKANDRANLHPRYRHLHSMALPLPANACANNNKRSKCSWLCNLVFVLWYLGCKIVWKWRFPSNPWFVRGRYHWLSHCPLWFCFVIFLMCRPT